jgi:hypothetical protein
MLGCLQFGGMELTGWQKEAGVDPSSVLLYPLNTESAMKKIEEHNTLVFVVNVK